MVGELEERVEGMFRILTQIFYSISPNEFYKGEIKYKKRLSGG